MAGAPCLLPAILLLRRREGLNGGDKVSGEKTSKSPEKGKAKEKTAKAAKKPRVRTGPSDEEILTAMQELSKGKDAITSTILRDHFNTKNRQVMRQAMRRLAKAEKIVITEKGGEGKRRQFVYSLP